jgi:hypothetical protein
METSGRGGRDVFMLSVPLAILLAFSILSGGGVRHVVHVLEVTLWAAVDFVRALFS